MTEITVFTPAISCGHCVHTIQAEVRDLPDVQRVTADKANKRVTIAFQAPATQAQIEALLVEIGDLSQLTT